MLSPTKNWQFDIVHTSNKYIAQATRRRDDCPHCGDTLEYNLKTLKNNVKEMHSWTRDDGSVRSVKVAQCNFCSYRWTWAESIEIDLVPAAKLDRFDRLAIHWLVESGLAVERQMSEKEAKASFEIGRDEMVLEWDRKGR